MLETDYAALGRDYGHRQLTNTVSWDRGSVSLWYETDIEREGEGRVVTHKAGVTVKRRKKKK